MFMPQFIFYYASPLHEYEVLPTVLQGAAAHIVTCFAKLICTASFVPLAADDSEFNLSHTCTTAAIALLDIAGLCWVLTRASGPALAHKLQAVGLGWSFMGCVLHRLAPLWGALGSHFSWEFLISSGHANANLMFSISFAAVVLLVYVRKNKTPNMLPLLYISMLLHAWCPVLQRCLEQIMHLNAALLLAVDVSSSIIFAVSSWYLYLACC